MAVSAPAFKRSLVLTVLMAAMALAPADAGPSACQLDGEYRGHVSTRSNISTRQGTFQAWFVPSSNCEGPGTMHLLLTSRIFGEVEPIIHYATGPYTISGDGELLVNMDDGVTWEGWVTGYCGHRANTVVFMASPSDKIIFQGAMTHVQACS